MKVDFEFRPNGSIIYAFLVLIFFVASGCNYYVVKSLEKDNYSSINELDKTHKYFVVHHNEEIYKMEGISVDSDMISGTLALVQREVYYSEYRSKAFKKEERGILREVHIYLRDDTKGIELGSNQIPLSSVYELKIIKKDTGRDIAAYVVAAGATAAVVAIIASSGSKNEPKPSPNEEASCNCPYIYVNNGKEYIFEGETLSAALASNLERDDYMKLPSISPTENTYRLKIANELRERQFLDVAELIVINHQKENKVLLDKYGQPHLIRNTESPVEAISFNGQNLESTLSSTDRKVYFFNDEDYSNNGVLLKFKKPQGIKNAKLVLNGKNTLWADHVYTIYSSKYGKYYNKWMKNQEILPPSQRMDLILGQDIQISIYLLQKGGWELVDYVLPVGIYSPRDLVVPIDLSNLNSDEIEIKIETGFMFWELDHVAIDYSEQSIPESITVKPMWARDAHGKSIVSKISQSDGQYFEQFETGTETELVFDVPYREKDQEQSVFLHCRGYFEALDIYEGRPDRATLRNFRNPGFFSEFSRAVYLTTLDKDYREATLVN